MSGKTKYQLTAEALNLQEEQELPTLPQLVFDVRMSLNGAADSWPIDLLRKAQNLFEMRLEKWHGRDDVIDLAVKVMVVEAVRLIESEIKQRKTDGWDGPEENQLGLQRYLSLSPSPSNTCGTGSHTRF